MTDKRLELMWQIERSRAESQHSLVVVLALSASACSLIPQEIVRLSSVAALACAAIIGTHYVKSLGRDVERDR